MDIAAGFRLATANKQFEKFAFMNKTIATTD